MKQIQKFFRDDVPIETLVILILTGVAIFRVSALPEKPSVAVLILAIIVVGLFIRVIWKALHRIIQIFPKTRMPIAISFSIAGLSSAIWIAFRSGHVIVSIIPIFVLVLLIFAIMKYGKPGNARGPRG